MLIIIELYNSVCYRAILSFLEAIFITERNCEDENNLDI